MIAGQNVRDVITTQIVSKGKEKGMLGDVLIDLDGGEETILF